MKIYKTLWGDRETEDVIYISYYIERRNLSYTSDYVYDELKNTIDVHKFEDLTYKDCLILKDQIPVDKQDVPKPVLDRFLLECLR